MLNRGAIIIVQDPDIRDIYIAECVERVNNELVEWPKVRVLHMIRYPMQRAIKYHDTAHENPPIRPDQVCRLRFTRTAGELDINMARNVGYEQSVQDMLLAEIANAEYRANYARQHPTNPNVQVDPAELGILLRHKAGDFRGKRSAIIGV